MSRKIFSNNLFVRLVTYVPSSIIPAAITLATSSIFTRIFTKNEYGMYNLFLVLANTFRVILSQWINQSIGRYLPDRANDDEISRLKSVIAIGHFLILGVELIFALLIMIFIKPLFESDWQALFLPCIIFVITSTVFDSLGLIFPAEMKARKYVFFKLSDSLITFALRILMVFVVFNMDVRVMFWSVVICNLILIPFMWKVLGMPGLKNIVDSLLDRKKLDEIFFWSKRFFTYGLPMTAWYFSNLILDVGDRYILQFLMGTEAVGIYSASYRLIGGSAALLSVPLLLTFHPFLMKASASHDKSKIGKILGPIIEHYMLATILATGILYLFHSDIALLLLGPDFREGSIIMPVVIAGVMVYDIGTFAHKPFEIGNNTKIMLMYAIFAAVINVALNFVFIPLVGYIGAAIATLAAYLIYTLCVGISGKRLIQWNINWKALSPRIIAVAVGIGAIFFSRILVERYSNYITGLMSSILLSGCLCGIILMQIFKSAESLIKNRS